MEETCEFRPWEELVPEALGLIFRNLSIQEKLLVIPRVCKSWGSAVTDPLCRQEIDLERCSGLFQQPETLCRMLEMLIPRSSGLLGKFCVYWLPNDQIFSLLSDNAKYLRTLKVPCAKISDSIVKQVAPRLFNLSFLDVSFCKNIGAPALEAIGKNCKHLTVLWRITHIVDFESNSANDEAFAIASTMPKLKQLRIAHRLVSTEAVLKILSSCPELEFLDMRGCWEVNLDQKFFDEFSGGQLKVVGDKQSY
ncbi:hypothetical protein UlMin_038504 [Ulmus minor]